jgi:hypothetical protein
MRGVPMTVGRIHDNGFGQFTTSAAVTKET